MKGYDDIPKEIPDPDAKKVMCIEISLKFYVIPCNQCSWQLIDFQPEDWDDEEDGEWTAPTIANPEYKGPWMAKVCNFLYVKILLC